MKKQIQLELEIAYEWAAIGDVDKALRHVDIAREYLVELGAERAKINEDAVAQENGGLRYYKSKTSNRAVGVDEELSPDEWVKITRAEYIQIIDSGKE